MSAQMTDQRILELLRLRRKVDAELARLANVERPGKRRSKFDAPECGTEQAWQRHRYYDEPQDDACKAAHRAHNRAQYARTIARTIVRAAS